MPWKNGLGVTTEILIEPSDATIGNFDWRLSMARINADGPFSSFPNIDRLLLVLEGRVNLQIEGRPAVALTPDDAPIRFPGELAVSATLITAPGALPRPAIDLNLISSSCGDGGKFFFIFRDIIAVWARGFCLHDDLVDQCQGAAL